MSADVGPGDQEPDDDEGIRAPVSSWSDKYMRAMLKLARHRMSEIDPSDPAQQRSWTAIRTILATLCDEAEARMALYAEVQSALDSSWECCPTCGTPRERDDDATA